MKRKWMPHRQAYAPQAWPPAVLAGITAGASAAVFDLKPLLALTVGVAIGYGVGWARWRIWRHRHPIISPEQYLDAMRNRADMN